MKIIESKTLILLCCLYSMGLLAAPIQTSKGFVLEGKVDGLKPGMKVYLLQEKDTISITTVDQQGRFRFKGYVPGEINQYTLMLDERLSNIACTIHLTNEKIRIAAFIEDWPVVKFAGSTVNDEMKQALKDIKYRELIDPLRAGPVVFNAGDFARVKTSYQHSMIAPLIIKQLLYFRLIAVEEGIAFFNSLQGRIKSNTYGKIVKEWLKEVVKADAEEKAVKLATQGIKPGELLPDFLIADQEGRKSSVMETIRRHKITLIDFWASWCGPCRAEVPNLKEVYTAFNEKGFNIIGVSSDAKTEDWKKAIKEDKTPWTHGINQENVSYVKFGITGIPAFILVDQNGKLIAFKAQSVVKSFGPEIRGELLYQTIEGLLNTQNRASVLRKL